MIISDVRYHSLSSADQGFVRHIVEKERISIQKVSTNVDSAKALFDACEDNLIKVLIQYLLRNDDFNRVGHSSR